jgi:hypothetical protein
MSNEDERGRGDNTTPTESHSDSYNGWANRETWAVALHINNDQGWQESVREAVRNTVDGIQQDPPAWLDPAELTDTFYANRAGDAIRENVEEALRFLVESAGEGDSYAHGVRDDIGSLWRVDWAELGASFLEDLGDDDA